LAALDALIRLDADPPEVAMRALIDTHPEHFDAMLILMGRRPGIHHTFLETLLGRDLGDDQWASLHAVLALSPAQKQASHLWNAWTLRVRVSDRGQAEAVDRPERSCDVDLVPEIANDYPRSRRYV